MVKRFECLRHLASVVKVELVVNGVGGAHHEWENLHPSDGNLFISGMGFVTPVALGLALGLPRRRILSVDGDGSMLMGLGVLATIGWKQPSNLTVLVFDNECYEAPGGLPTATAGNTDLASVGRAVGIRSSKETSSLDEFKEAIAYAFANGGPHLVIAKVDPGTLKVTPISTDGLETKYRFVRHIENTERRAILSAPTLPPRLKKVVEDENST